MSGRLDGKVALITGGATGQGAAEAKLFCDVGCRVFITDINTDLGEETAKRLGETCTFLQHDVASQEDWDHVMERIDDLHGKLDVLVNNAGIFHVRNLEETTLEYWNQSIAVNQTGTFLGMKKAIPLMKKGEAGSIINISSIAGLKGPIAVAYGAAKWAVRGMTKSAAVELGKYGIRVNSVHPGYIDTPMLDGHGVSREELSSRVPLSRTGDVSEVAKLVLFLASDESAYCSGHEFVIDGALCS